MGAVLSSWRLGRVKQSTVEILEGIEQEIALLEENRERAERQQRLWIGRLVLYSASFYCCAAALFWFLYFPDLWLDRLLFILPFIIFPILIHMMKKFLSWWFVKSKEKDVLALEEQRDKKKRILEEVMEKETYKNAKEILEKFDPELKKAKQQEQQQLAASQVQTSQELRQRTVAQRGLPSPPASPSTAGAQITNARGVIGSTSPPGLIAAPGGPPEKLLMTSPHGPVPGRRFAPIDVAAPCAPGMHPPGPPLPRPILPRQRGMADRIIEYLVGDGPQNRYGPHCYAFLNVKWWVRFGASFKVCLVHIAPMKINVYTHFTYLKTCGLPYLFLLLVALINFIDFTSATEGEGGYVFIPFCLSVCLFVCLIVCLFVFRISQKVVDGSG
uniref:Lunapark, ER junction formation factor n=2 Tax=Eptatretus burgeri TaxID=7764 RepID=A0A8C4QWE0_EPTBU